MAEKRNVNKIYSCPSCHAPKFFFDNAFQAWRCKECNYKEKENTTKEELPTSEEFVASQREKIHKAQAEAADQKRTLKEEKTEEQKTEPVKQEEEEIENKEKKEVTENK